LKPELSIFWFRRDLRLYDSTGLFHALAENQTVLPVFIFDKTILGRLDNSSDRRVDFIHQALEHIQKTLAKLGASIHVLHATPLQAFTELTKVYTITKVYCNHDYEPYARTRDEEIKNFLSEKGIPFYSFKDQCIFEKEEVVKDDGKPYTIFTPYSRKWKSRLVTEHYKPYATNQLFKHFYKTAEVPMPALKHLGFEKTDMQFQPDPEIRDQILTEYALKRNFPALNASSRLSVYLRFGTISIRELVRKAIPLSEIWLNELIWREFYMMILWHFPHAATEAFKPDYNNIVWRNDEKEFKLWCKGLTGFPIVDAGMRELNATGFMHNRVRMIVSSFLVKDLLIDWRWGEAYFAAKLNDFDLSANNGGWQWAAGTGCDAAPYFRVFNPTEQQKKFDPEFKYIKQWVPEFGTPAYPQPMVDHSMARQRALLTYKSALNEVRQMRLFNN
jgi:deoxyribodipyrimidine photo-lyase